MALRGAYLSLPCSQTNLHALHLTQPCEVWALCTSMYSHNIHDRLAVATQSDCSVGLPVASYVSERDVMFISHIVINHVLELNISSARAHFCFFSLVVIILIQQNTVGPAHALTA